MALYAIKSCILIILFSHLAETEKTLRRFTRQTDEGEFLIYRSISESKGLCLLASQQLLNGRTVYTLQLKRICSFGNAEAHWVRLQVNSFRNVKYFKCLTAALTLDGFISGRLTLKPCDDESRYQKFVCDSSCGVVLLKSSGKATHTLDHEEVLRNGLEVAVPLLRLGTGSHLLAKWIVHDPTGKKETSCICSVPVPVFKVGKQFKITTAIGGRVVGKPCVFPFIYKTRDVWQCFRKDNKYICATVRNLDRNFGQWGVCPFSKRGTFSEWLPPGTCDKPCGGGRVYKQRKCLFPPCKGSLVGIQPEACNVRQCYGDAILTVGGDSAQYALEALPLRNGGPISLCKFPYVVDGQPSQVCRSDHRRKRSWCSLTNNFDTHKKWGYCVSETKGLWTSWLPPDKASCSKSCGGGYLIQTRICHQPPCLGKSKLPGGRCNTQECPQCFNSKGENYRGEKSVANDGTLCQFWKLQSPHSHPEESPKRYAELVQNYCRNPGGRGSLPYCYRNNQGSPSKMYCDLVPCGVDIDKPGVPYTIPTTFSDKHSIVSPCTFPFLFHLAWYDICIAYDKHSRGREQCIAITNEGTKINSRYCPSYVRGKWSDWLYTGDCTKSCGSGYQISFRRCFLSPCLGKAVRVDESKQCNTHACAWSQPGAEDCFTGRGLTYEGSTSKSLGGYTCKHWSSVPNHSAALHNEMLPQDMPRLIENHCRNPLPGTYHGPWCFVEIHSTIKWMYCDVPKCPTKESEIFGLAFSSHLRHNNHSCSFPFLGADNKVHDRCAPANPFKKAQALKYCGYGLPSNYKTIISNPIELYRYTDAVARERETVKFRSALSRGFTNRRYGLCPRSTQGTWSSWADKTKCSVECGGGFVVRLRSCLHPPCAGARSADNTFKKPCNQHKCPTCLVGNGKLYRGTVNVGYLEDLCMKWSNVNRDITQFHPGKYVELQGNFCRNPGGYYPIPWCYRKTQQRNILIRIFCDVSHCSDKLTSFTVIPFTIPDSENHRGYNHSGKACIFPYLMHGDWYHSCVIWHQDRNIHVCQVTAGDNNQRSTFAICPPHYRGKWTAWKYSNTCTKSCGGGRKLFVRECLFLPCEGSKFKFEGKCNTQKCIFQSRLKENIDCFIGDGTSYTGTRDRSVTNTICTSWHASNLFHRYFYTGIALMVSYCRNPSPLGKRSAPWCYTYITSVHQKWEYCDVPRCPAYEGEIFTLGGPSDGRPCHFPFWSNGKQHNTCIEDKIDIRIAGQMVDRKNAFFCATTSTTAEQHPSRSQGSEWGICPRSYRGTLSAWALVREADMCSQKCGGGQIRYRRKCRFEPCKAGISYIKLQGSCNTHPCDEPCVVGKGMNYKGSVTHDGARKCLNWSSVNYRSYQLGSTLLNPDHNYCRNLEPSRYHFPFCLISARRVVICDLPYCNDNTSEILAYDLNTKGTKCYFPFFRNGKLTDSCFSLDNPAVKYCGFARGNNDVVAERLYGKCSRYKVGTWSDWKLGSCNRPCGGGQSVQWRICRYPPCNGPSQRYVGTCNDIPCDKTSNCYDARTKGVEFRGSAREYTSGHNCISYQGSLCLTHTEIIGSLPRPVCYIRVTGLSELQLKFCRVRHCPDSVDGPVMVQPKIDNTERPYSPCIFPFKHEGKLFHRCVAKTEVKPPTPDETRPKETSFWCSTNEELLLNPNEWGYCKNVDRGTWGKWSKDLKRCTAMGLSYESRHCLFPPCLGKIWRILPQPCGHPLYSKYSWSKWTPWTSCEKCSGIKTRHRNCLGTQRITFETGLNTLKYCRGFSTDVQPCWKSSEKKNACSHLFVYGETDPLEVLHMTQTYSRRKFLGKGHSSGFSFSFSYSLAFLCLCVAWCFN